MYRIVVLSKANQDILNAEAWYNEQGGAVVGLKFKQQLLGTVEKLQNELIEHAIAYRGLSRSFVKNFPYTLYFVKHNDIKLIIIYAVLHNKQNKSALSKRI